MEFPLKLSPIPGGCCNVPVFPVSAAAVLIMCPAGGGGSRASNESPRRLREDFTITEKAATRAFSWLKVATTAYTCKKKTFAKSHLKLWCPVPAFPAQLRRTAARQIYLNQLSSLLRHNCLCYSYCGHCGDRGHTFTIHTSTIADSGTRAS